MICFPLAKRQKKTKTALKYEFSLSLSLSLSIYIYTPWKINMELEPKNHLFEKENHLPNLHYYVPC